MIQKMILNDLKNQIIHYFSIPKLLALYMTVLYFVYRKVLKNI